MQDSELFNAGGPLSTGVAEVDRQHARLGQMLGRLVQGAAGESSTPEVQEGFQSLVAFLNDHFATEEAILEDMGSDLLSAIADEHREIMDFASLAQSRLDGGQAQSILKDLFLLEDFVFKHLVTMDVKALRRDV